MTRSNPLDRGTRRRTLALPILVLLVALIATLTAASATRTAIAEKEQTRFEAEVDKLDAAILNRMGTYEQILHGARGLIDANGNVSRAQWRAYVDALNISRSFPGIQGVGWTILIPASDLDEHTATIRAQGFPDYHVWPEGDRPVYTSIIYLEPFRDRNLRAFGFDMYAEPVRHAGMERARDTGQAALSGRVRLVQETDEDVQPGFLMYVPVYRDAQIPPTIEERRNALVGYVYAPFRARDLMTGVLGPGAPDVEFAIFDTDRVGDTTRLYNTVTPNDFQPQLQRQLSIAGRTWTVQYMLPARSFETALLPTTILLGGLAISGLLFGLTLATSTRKEHAVQLADKMTLKLRQSQEALERSNRELEQFAYVASHDLREPLRSVSGFMDLLRHHANGTLDETGHRYLEYALQGSRRMHRLVDGLLEYSRINGTHEPPDFVELNETWDEAVQALSAQIRDTQSTVTRDALPRVYGHRDQFVRVFQNLISNAIKYRGTDAARIHASAVLEHGSATVAVRDNGIGIDPKFQQQLFVLFRRLHAQHQIEGTGVGLAVCKRIIELHGGRIWVESEAGKGATFKFTLPLGRPPPIAHEEPLR